MDSIDRATASITLDCVDPSEETFCWWLKHHQITSRVVSDEPDRYPEVEFHGAADDLRLMLVLWWGDLELEKYITY